jgi:hypothetical protein
LKESAGVREGILRFYERFSAGDANAVAQVIANEPGVSVIGTGPGEGHEDRQSWIEAYGTGTSLSASRTRKRSRGRIAD